jgi:NAD(P)-dependent dehydrogenase (short-subunit alcohol dehydrogenase family)
MTIANYSLAGKKALVTGGSRGIGRAIALAFAEQGADVAVSARKLPDLEAVAGEIKAMGRKALAIASHVAKVDESKALVEQVKKEFGRIDILVNNAGTNPYSGPLIDAEEWAWDVTNNVNIKGPFMLSLMVAKLMKEQGGGNIINITSAAGLRPSSLHIYSITKAALVMMTRVMSNEFAQYNIRVNAIAPGVIKTRLSEMLWRNNPNPDAIPQPEDVGGTAVYLASDASRHVTGVTILIAAGAVGE